MTDEKTKQIIQSMASEIVSGLKLENLNDTTREELKNLIQTRIDNQILNTIMENLNEEDLTLLAVSLDVPDITDEQKADLFLEFAGRIPDFQQKLTEAIVKLVHSIKEDTEQFRAVHKSTVEKK